MSTKLRLRRQDSEFGDYEQDVRRIVRAFAASGYEISANEAYEAWQQYSDGMSAGWLFLPELDEEVFSAIFSLFYEPYPDV